MATTIEVSARPALPGGLMVGDYLMAVRPGVGTAQLYQCPAALLQTVIFGSGLTLFANTVSVAFGTVSGTVAAGDDSRITGAQQQSAKGLANGYAGLDGTGKVPAAQLPPTSGAVTSVAGRIGAITLSASDVSGLGALAVQSAVTLAQVGQGGATTGQVLAWNGTTYAPTSLTGSYTLPVATGSVLGGVKQGTGVLIAGDGTLSLDGQAATALTDISTVGGPALSDITVLNRAGTDYKGALSGAHALFRRTPAGSRTVTLTASTGAGSIATLTATDHDKTVVVAGAFTGSLAADGTITDGFRCEVINHTGSALTYSGITGLGGAASLANAARTSVTLAAASLEAGGAGGAGATTTIDALAAASSVAATDKVALSQSGTVAAATVAQLNASASAALLVAGGTFGAAVGVSVRALTDGATIATPLTGNIFAVTVGATARAFSTPPGGLPTGVYTYLVTMGVANAAPTFWTGIVWLGTGGNTTAPTFSTTSGATDAVTIIKSGSTYYGTFAKGS